VPHGPGVVVVKAAVDAAMHAWKIHLFVSYMISHVMHVNL
jgi:hypothetical protein